MNKILKFIGIFILGFLGLILCGVAYFFISNRLFLGSSDQQFVNYLTQNQASWKSGIDDRLFSDDFYVSDVFLYGEIHGFADNQRVDRDLFLFLNRKLGVRYYLAEMDSTQADRLNTFLVKPEKDSTLLKDVVKAIEKRIPQQSSQELMDKWNAIYEYNQSLSDSLKITVLGIDMDFEHEDPTISRDSAMIMNFRNMVQRRNLQQEKFYGFFGFYHVLQSEPKDMGRPFACRLKKSNYKVSSIASYTLDSEMYLPANPQFPTPPDEKIDLVNSDGPFMLVKGINDLKESSESNSITLFKLNGEQSPYGNSQKLISVKSTMFGDSFFPTEEQKTTDYFQYVVLLRNSKALSKLKL